VIRIRLSRSKSKTREVYYIQNKMASSQCNPHEYKAPTSTTVGDMISSNVRTDKTSLSPRMGVKQRLVVAKQIPGRNGPTFEFVEFDSFIRLARWHLADSDSSHYEVIEGQQNLYFDFDGEFDIVSLVDAIKKRYSIFEELYRKSLPISVDLYSSCDSVKKSYHIVVKGVCFYDHAACGTAAREIIDMAFVANPEIRRSFDSSVYTSKRNLRLLHSRKIDSTRVKIFGGSVYRSPGYIAPSEDADSRLLTSLVSYVLKCQCVGSPMQVPNSPPVLIEDLTEDNVVGMLELVDERMPGIFSRREVRGKTLVLRRNRPGMCVVCARVHSNENAMVVLRRSLGVDVPHFICFRDLGQSVPLQCNEEVVLAVSDRPRCVGAFGGGYRIANVGPDIPKVVVSPIEELAEKIVRRYPFYA
jgi:hypothetical protein